MKRAFIATVEIFEYVSYCGTGPSPLAQDQAAGWAYLSLPEQPQVLMVGWGRVRGGRIRASGTGHNGNCCADCDHGADAQAGNGGAGSCASCWCSCCWCRSWCRLSHGLCGSKAQNCRSDQNFLHEISF